MSDNLDIKMEDNTKPVSLGENAYIDWRNWVEATPAAKENQDCDLHPPTYDQLIMAYRFANAWNAENKKLIDSGKATAKIIPQEDEVFESKHTVMCTEATREAEWFVFDDKLQVWNEVGSIDAMIVEVMDDLGVPWKQTNVTLANLKTRLRARHTIRNLSREPALIKNGTAHQFTNLNKADMENDPLGWPIACRTHWYLIKPDGSSKKTKYSSQVFLLNRLPVDPEEGEAKYTEWWVEDRLGADQARAFWEWAAYCLTPYNSLKKFHIWFGDTNTGKTTGCDLLKLILGNTNVSNESALSLDYVKNRFTTSSIRGALLNVSEEDAGYGQSFEKSIKNITGGGAVPWEIKNGAKGSDLPTYRLLFTSNDKPKIVDNSDAYAGRIIALAWDQPLPKERATISEIVRKFRKELPQIIHKCIKVREELATRKLHIPTKSKALLNEILYGSSEVGEWFQECVTFQAEHKSRIKDLYVNYRVWCEENGIHKPAAINIFAKRLRRLPAFESGELSCTFTDWRTNKDRGFQGIKLTPAAQSKGIVRE